MRVTSLLLQWGVVPTIACNGALAVALAGRQDFDLILMEITMPVMDGVVATARIRQSERENPARTPVPIVAYTELDLGAYTEQIARVGWSAVLHRPCSASSLRTCLALCCPDQGFPN
jgi:CheY-like chemotaxis protein